MRASHCTPAPPMPPSPHHPDPAFATTLAHGLAVLQCFRAGEPSLTNKDLAERTGLSKSTITRLTYTLAARGLLHYDPSMRRYQLGSTALSLSYPLLANLRVRQLARPSMQSLADQMGGSVSLGMRDRLQMVYVETSRGHDAALFRPDIGAALPMLGTAMGRAWLAQAAPAEREGVLAALRDAEPELWRRYSGAVEAAVQDLARLGFCRSHADWQSDIHAVAVPMKTRIDGEILIFNCGVPAARLRPGQLERKVGPLLRVLVAQVEHMLAEF